jgi:protein tyrosine phosphatase
VHKFSKECGARNVSEWASYNGNDKKLYDCLHEYVFMDAGGQSVENTIPDCQSQNRFNETYTYKDGGLTKNDDVLNYLNSAIFRGRLEIKKEDDDDDDDDDDDNETGNYVYNYKPHPGKGFIAATSAPLGNVEDVINDKKLHPTDEVEPKECGDFSQNGKDINSCVSANRRYLGLYEKQNTILNFYKTLRNKNVKYVVMLTNFVEKVNKPECICKVKADKYFPIHKNDDDSYETFEIPKADRTKVSGYTVKAEDANAERVKRMIGATKFEEKVKKVDVRELSFKNRSGKVTHKLTHIHFKGWLDFGVPEGIEEETLFSLIQFTIKKIDMGKNVIVHCTGGIGRTGTFIASVLSSGLKKSVKFNLLKFILKLRQRRSSFVETIGQIAFVRKNIGRTAIDEDIK